MSVVWLNRCALSKEIVPSDAWLALVLFTKIFHEDHSEFYSSGSKLVDHKSKIGYVSVQDIRGHTAEYI